MALHCTLAVVPSSLYAQTIMIINNPKNCPSSGHAPEPDGSVLLNTNQRVLYQYPYVFLRFAVLYTFPENIGQIIG